MQVLRRILVRARVNALILTAALIFGLAGSAHAALLGVTAGRPDITSGFLTATYDSGTGVLDVDGWALGYYPDWVTPHTDLTGTGTFDLQVVVANDGTFVPNGTLNITGDLGSGFQTLFSGNITAVGFSGSTIAQSQILDFLLVVTGGLPEFGAAGASILGSLSFSETSPGVYSDGGNATSDTFAVPEPGALMLLASGLALTFRRSRRKQSQ